MAGRDASRGRTRGGAPTTAELLAPDVVAGLRAQPLTYREVGATGARLPAGYHHQRLSAPIGFGRRQFGAAAEALLTWQMHQGAGMVAAASDLRVRPGAVAVLRLRIGPITLRVPVRVGEVIEEPRRRGFVYGTLPGHPVRGEERFVVEQEDDGTVVFALTAFSRAGRWFTLLGGPMAHAGQQLMTRRYVNALRAVTLTNPDPDASPPPAS